MSNAKNGKKSQPANPSTEQPLVLGRFITSNKFPWVCMALWCLAIGLMRVLPRATVLNNPSSFTDYFIPLSGAWALDQGLKLHTDASSPLGVLFYAPYYWCSAIIGMTDQVVKYTQGALFGLISVITFIALRPPRFNWMITGCATAYFGLFATNPCNMGDSPFISYEGVAYNHLAFVLGQIAFLVALFPKSRIDKSSGRDEAIDGSLVGLLLTWLFFIKASLVVVDSFLITSGLVLLYFTGVRRTRSFFISLCITAVFLECVVIALFNISLTDMFRDLRLASLARGNSISHINSSQYMHGNLTWGVASMYSDTIGRLNDALLDFAPYLPVCLGAIVWAAARVDASVKRLLVIFGVLGMVFCMDLVRPIFNSCSLTFGFLWIVFLCFFEQFRVLIPDDYGKRLYRVLFVLLTMIVILATGRIFAAHLVCFVYNVSAPKWFPPQNPKAWAFKPEERIGGGHFENLYLMRSDADVSGHSCADRLNKGIEILQKNNLIGKAIMGFDFENQFPILLRAPYPTGQPVWLDGGGTFDETNHLPAAMFFKGTDVILDSHRPTNPNTKMMLIKVYKDYTDSHFIEIDQNDCWDVYIRKK